MELKTIRPWPTRIFNPTIFPVRRTNKEAWPPNRYSIFNFQFLPHTQLFCSRALSNKTNGNGVTGNLCTCSRVKNYRRVFADGQLSNNLVDAEMQFYPSRQKFQCAITTMHTTQCLNEVTPGSCMKSKRTCVLVKWSK